MTTEPDLTADRPATQPHDGPGKAASQVATLCWRGVIKIRRNPAGLADVVIGPAIFLVLFGYVFGGAIAGDTDAYLQYVFPGIVGMTTLFATMGVSVSLSTDLAAGFFDRLRSLPLLRSAPLAGAIGADVIRQLVSFAALTAFGLLLGVRFTTSPISVLAAWAVALLFAFTVSWAWVLLALAIKETQAVQGLGAVLILPLAFASNIFVPPTTMPGWMQTIAAWNPIGHLVDTMRGLMMGGPVAEPLLDSALWMTGFVVLFVPLSLLAYHRRAA